MFLKRTWVPCVVTIKSPHLSEGLNGGTSKKLFIFWLCNMKQLNFTHFNTNSKKFLKTGNVFQKEAKTAPKRPILFCLARNS